MCKFSEADTADAVVTLVGVGAAAQLAAVVAQLKLASVSGYFDGYLHFLFLVGLIEANEKVGLAQADNIKGADF